MVRDPREFAFDNFFVETLHVIGPEWRHKGTHLVEYAAKGPDIAFAVIRLVTPDFGAGIVRCTRLGVTQALLHDLADIKVAQLGLHVFEQE